MLRYLGVFNGFGFLELLTFNPLSQQADAIVSRNRRS